MKNIYSLGILVTVLFLYSFTPLDAEQHQYHLTSSYSVKFEAKNAKGSFKDLKGVIHFDPENLENSKFNMEIKVASIHTGFFLKNNHAKSANWFDADNFPTINFVSSNISNDVNGFKVRGNLTMHGVVKEIVVPFTFEENIFAGSFEINRLDYKIGSNEGLAAKVPETIRIILHVPVED